MCLLDHDCARAVMDLAGFALLAGTCLGFLSLLYRGSRKSW